RATAERRLHRHASHFAAGDDRRLRVPVPGLQPVRRHEGPDAAGGDGAAADGDHRDADATGGGDGGGRAGGRTGWSASRRRYRANQVTLAVFRTEGAGQGSPGPASEVTAAL